MTILIAVTTACTPDLGQGWGDTGGELDGGDILDVAPGLHWGDVQCLESSFGPIAVARVADSVVWSYVVHVDELDRRWFEGEVDQIDVWGADSCAVGVVPTGDFIERRCYVSTSSQLSTCYVGDGEWFSAALPECTAITRGPAWADWSCADGSPDTPFDDLTCTFEELACFAWTGNVGIFIEPRCVVDEFEPLELELCL